jgi:hypothetical protein
MKELLKSLLVTVLTTTLALICAEAAFRIVSGKRIFALTQYRAANIVLNEFPKNVMSYDPLLGWRVNSGVGFPTAEQIALNTKTPNFHTIDFGVRRNNAANEHPQPGGVLMSGASFTAGSEVGDEAAWPAQLETLIGQPVVNGAVGGFGTDQIVLRAEELLPTIKPKVLVIDLVQDNIATAGYSYSGYPKPYFIIEDGQLVLQNNPVPRYEPRDDPYESLKNVLSHSLMIDRIMATYFPDSWYSSRTQNFTRANNDEVNVSCLLLQRLKKETDDAGVRLLITMQYGGGTIATTSSPDGNVVLVEQCIVGMGIQLIDEFATLKELWRNHPDEFRSLYVIRNDVLGHKSRAGNLAVAKAVAAALAIPAPAGDVSGLRANREFQEERRLREVLLSATDLSSLFPKSPLARLEGKTNGAYRVVATGGNTEHFVAAPTPSIDGILTFSVDASAAGSSHLRLQLLARRGDSEVNGVLGDFDLRTTSAGAQRLGLVENISAGIKPIGDGWSRIWITGKFPSKDSKGSILIQIVNDRGNYTFVPDGDAVNIRRVNIERGEAPSENPAPMLTATPG